MSRRRRLVVLAVLVLSHERSIPMTRLAPVQASQLGNFPSRFQLGPDAGDAQRLEAPRA